VRVLTPIHQAMDSPRQMHRPGFSAILSRKRSRIRAQPMITQVPLGEAVDRLPELVRRLAPGDEIVITDHDEPVARLIGQAKTNARRSRVPGSAKGRLVVVQEDEDHLDDFADYMP